MATYSDITGNNTTWRTRVYWSFVPATASWGNYGARVLNSTAIRGEITPTVSTGTFYINNVSGWRTDTYTSYAQNSSNYVNISLGGTWVNKTGSSIYFNNKTIGAGGTKWNYLTATNYKWTSVSASTRNFNMRTNSPATSTLSKWFNTTLNCGVSVATTYSLDNSTWQTSNTFTGLTPNKTYTIYVKAVATSASSNTSTTYGSLKATTYASHPTSLTISQTGATATSISIQVGCSTDAAVPVTNYTVYYGKNGSTSLTPYDMGTSTTATITGLEPETDYNFVLVATNAAGEYCLLNIPDGYTGLAHIESDRYEYIDTGYKPNPRSKISLVAGYTNPTVAAQQRLFCTVNGLSFDMYINGNYNFAWACQDDTGNWQTTGFKADTLGRSFILDSYNNKVQVGNLYSATISTTRTKTASENLLLFCQPSGTSVTNGGAERFYRGFICESGQMIHAYQPVKRNSDGAFGLYDSITNTFLPNLLSGHSFTAGAEWASPSRTIFSTSSGQAEMYVRRSFIVVPSTAVNTRYEYVSGGTLGYTDTGINPNTYGNNLTVEMKIRINTLDNDWHSIMGASKGDVNGTWYFNPQWHIYIDTNNVLGFQVPVDSTPSSNANSLATIAVETGKIYTIKAIWKSNGLELIVNGISYTKSCTNSTVGPNANLYLWTRNYENSSSTITPASYATDMDVFYCKIWDGNGNLLRNLRASGAAPMAWLVDTLTGTRYYNLGAGGSTGGLFPTNQVPWVKGKVWIKVNGVWEKAKEIYTKTSDVWKKGV